MNESIIRTFSVRPVSSIAVTGASALAILLGCVPNIARAQVTGFVNNPTANSTDFGSFVSGKGGQLNTDVNFDAEAVGTLQPDFYLASEGLTITTNQVKTDVITFGPGPSEDGTLPPPISAGEGVHPSSNYLTFSSATPNVVTFSFTNAISAFGVYTIDLFNPNNDGNIFINAYSGQNATGTLLGSFSSVAFNFQENRLYFEGVATMDGEDEIGSVTITRSSDTTFETSGLDNVEFARSATGAVAAPEPGAAALVIVGAIPAIRGMMRRRRLLR